MGNLRAIRRKRIEVKEISITQSVILLTIFILSGKIVGNAISYISEIVTKQNGILTKGEATIIGLIIMLILQIIQISIIGKVCTKKHTLIKNKNELYCSQLKQRYIKKGKYIRFIFLIIIGITLFRNGTYLEMLSNFEGPISSQQLDKLVKSTTPVELFAILNTFLFSAFVTAPILEEVLFRGIIFKGLLNKYKNPIAPIIVSALVFAIGHLNIPQGINAFILGMILASIYYYTESLTLAMIAHSIANILAVVPTPKKIYMKIAFAVIGGGCLTIGMKKMINKSKEPQLKFA